MHVQSLTVTANDLAPSGAWPSALTQLLVQIKIAHFFYNLDIASWGFPIVVQAGVVEIKHLATDGSFMDYHELAIIFKLDIHCAFQCILFTAVNNTQSFQVFH